VVWRLEAKGLGELRLRVKPLNLWRAESPSRREACAKDAS
jgi:hypothetical protein